MSDPIIASAKAAIGGLREAIAIGKEADALAKDIAELGQAELQARSALRQRQQQVKGDTTVSAAIQEWERLNEIKEAENALRAEILKLPNGAEKWAEIQSIKKRKQAEAEQERLAYKTDAQKMKALKWWSFLFGLVGVILLKLTGML